MDRTRVIPAEDTGTVLNDEIMRFANEHPRGERGVAVARPEHDRPLVLAINDLDIPARSITQRYQDYWQIELYFKWIRQHLRITTFLARREDCLREIIPDSGGFALECRKA